MKRLWILAAVLFLGGCGLRVGYINDPPAPTGVATPSRVTVTRDSSIIGYPVPMIVQIDGVEIYGLWSGQSHSFMLEPGDYIFGYFLGFNECRRFMRILPTPSQRIRLGPECQIENKG